MGILSSMYTGVTGMASQGEALAVYGDNIANANSTGFKTSRPEFSDIVASSMKGVMGGNQVGRGTKLANIAPIFAQGSIVSTESGTDLAISGDGFFVVNGSDGTSYSRSGAFHFDKEGKLVNANGQRIMGFQIDTGGKTTSKLEPIRLDKTVVDAKKTEYVDMFMNLDLRADKGVEFDPKKPEQTSQFATGTTVYDTAGTAHVITLYFNKTDDGVWTYRAMAKGEEVVGGKEGDLVEQASGTLKFTEDGRLKEQAVSKSAFNFNKGALPDQSIEFKFGKDISKGGDGTQVTQYGTNSEVYKSHQDGATAGSLTGLTFTDDGKLAAAYTNGQTINVAEIALAKFENSEGLFKVGGGRYKESRASGAPTVGSPGGGGRGTVSAKSLESSTTDIANEFINLMTAQRNFQANTRVVKAGDEMMSEILNMKQ